MKAIQISLLIAKLQLEGFDSEVPISVLKRELVGYIGCDKYRLKYQIEALVECGYFSWENANVLKITEVR